MNSDGANIILMSWDMLHGNLLLHGWWMSDVSFYTTELPEYMLIDAIRGLSPDVTHIAAALTYTLVLVLAVLLARSRATARDGAARGRSRAGSCWRRSWARASSSCCCRSGTSAPRCPILAVWLLLDRAPPRWYVPVIAGVMLAWAMVADSLVLVVAIVPLVLVATARAVRLVAGGTALRDAWYEMSLAAAAAAAIGVVVAGAAGDPRGRRVHPAPGPVQPGRPGAAGAARRERGGQPADAVRRQLRSACTPPRPSRSPSCTWPAWPWWPGRCAACCAGRLAAGLVDQVLVVAIVVNLAVYLFSSFSSGVLNGREIALVLPFGAALAGRSLGPRVRGTRLASGAAGRARRVHGRAWGTSWRSRCPRRPTRGSPSWLQQHHLTTG